MFRRLENRGVRIRCVSTMMAFTLLSAACGSTAQWSNTVTGGYAGDGVAGRGQEGLGLEDTDVGTSGEVIGGQDGPGVASELPSTLGWPNKRHEASATKVSGTPKEPSSISPENDSGRGFTRTEIKIGYSTFEDLSQLGEAAGVSTNVDQRKIVQAIVDDLNKRGGIADRKVVPVFYDYEAQDIQSNSAAAAQKACTTWTEDDPVFAAINSIAFVAPGGGDELLAACLAQHETPLQTGPSLRPKRIYQRYAPYLTSTGGLSIERYAKSLVERLGATNYFAGRNTITGQSDSSHPIKIGLLSSPTQYGEEFRQIIRNELSRHGYPVAAEFEFSGDDSRASDESTFAVRRFQDAGVTHVIATIYKFFLHSAESQRYRPRYVFTSANGALTAVPDIAPRAQLFGARGIGWVPATDMRRQQRPIATAAAKRCQKIIDRSGGQQSQSGASDSLARYVGYTACDNFNYLAMVIDASGRTSVEGIRTGAQQVGDFPTALTFRMSFRGARFDGASAVRDLAYMSSCQGSQNGCFVYTSKDHAA